MHIISSGRLEREYDAVSRLAHETGEPIYVTKAGEGDLVLLSMEAYEALGPAALPAVTTQTEGEAQSMTERELAQALRAMYQNAPLGDRVAAIHVFAIRYAAELERPDVNKATVLELAGMSNSYKTEISKGMRLARYVTLRPDCPI